MAAVLLYAEVRGSSQGLLKLCGAGIPRERITQEIAVTRSSTSIAKVDAGRRSGMVAMQRAVDVAIELVRVSGVAVVEMSNTSSSTGAIGYFSRQLAEAEHIGIVASGTPALVAPFGAGTAALGTNPLSIAIPTLSQPMVLDITTAAIPFFDVLRAQALGSQLPSGVALDSHGEPTIDPTAALNGAFLALDRGARGAGLALALEVLTGVFVGADSLGKRGARKDWGNLVIALDPGIFIQRSQFLEGVQRLFDTIRALPRMSGFQEILIPGERGDRCAAAVEHRSAIELSDEVYSELSAIASKTCANDGPL